MRISTVGVDLAKNIFQVHAETADGQVVFNRALRRGRSLPSSRGLSNALLAWKRVPQAITGRVRFRSMAMRSA